LLEAVSGIDRERVIPASTSPSGDEVRNLETLGPRLFGHPRHMAR
jgi:hypothetical protein